MLLRNVDGTYGEKAGKKSRKSKEEGHIEKKQGKKSHKSKEEGHIEKKQGKSPICQKNGDIA